MDERVNPIKITDNSSNLTYELDFNRESVRFAEARGFRPEDVLEYPATKVPELFYYAFRKNHRQIARNRTDAILDLMGGMTPSVLQRLIDLYNQAVLSNNNGAAVLQSDEDAAKNSKVTVEM